MPLSFVQALDAAMPWRTEALCADYPKLRWVNDIMAAWHKPAGVVKMLEVCSRCPVRRPCLEFALNADPEMWGVMGGTVHIERRRTLPAGLFETMSKDERAAAVKRTADRFEATLAERIEQWRAWGEAGVRPAIPFAPCPLCGGEVEHKGKRRQRYCAACLAKQRESASGLTAAEVHERDLRRVVRA